MNLHKRRKSESGAFGILGAIACDGIKESYPCEEKAVFKMAKKLVAARDLPAGHVLTREDIAIKSPNDGLPPYELDRVIGRATRQALQQDKTISFDDLKDI